MSLYARKSINERAHLTGKRATERVEISEMLLSLLQKLTLCDEYFSNTFEFYIEIDNCTYFCSFIKRNCPVSSSYAEV